MKYSLVDGQTYNDVSPSSRGRGLKYTIGGMGRVTTTSPSSRGRGLKSSISPYDCYATTVALFTRAWIEIGLRISQYLCNVGRPLHEGVD